MITLILFILALPSFVLLISIGLTFFSSDSDANKRWRRMQILIAHDQLINTLFKGWADESISSRAYRRSLDDCYWCPVMKRIIDTCFFWDKDHCKKSYISEQERHQFPPELRGN